MARVLSAAECSRLERDAELMLILWDLRIRLLSYKLVLQYQERRRLRVSDETSIVKA